MTNYRAHLVIGDAYARLLLLMLSLTPPPMLLLLPKRDVQKMQLTVQTTSVRTRFHSLAFFSFSHHCISLEFAYEIGSSLLTEVRRLQTLLGERDKAIQNMKEEKDDLEKAVESLRTALREQEQNAGMHLFFSGG